MSAPYASAALRVIGLGAAAAVALGWGRAVFVQSLDAAPPPAVGQADAAGAPASVSVDGFSLASVSASLPDDDPPYPAGDGAELMNANCTACHSASMALTQPALSRAQWTATVQKMRDAYKAPVADRDVAAIVDYLAATSARLGGASAPGGVSGAPDATG